MEATGIIVRGELRRTIPISSITVLRVDGPKLLFRTSADDVAFALGPVSAQKWLVAMKKPPITLAQKLGIEAGTRILVLGNIACRELFEAVAVGRSMKSGAPDLIIACVDSQSSLSSALQMSLSFAKQGCAMWFVYTKGASSAVGETVVRTAARAVGMRDTKVASVSAQFSALRFSLLK